MNRNICRPFVLCNGFIPPINEVHHDWRFLSFGYLDEIIVGNNLLDDKMADLHKIWEYYQEQGAKPDGDIRRRLSAECVQNRMKRCRKMIFLGRIRRYRKRGEV